MTDQITGKQLVRDDRGRFAKGNSSGGRLPVEREVRYYEILKTEVTYDDWRAIIKRAVNDAKRGDSVARKWIADYLIGPPVERKEVTGADGNALRVIVDYAGSDSDTDTE